MSQDIKLPWGPHLLPKRAATVHFLVLGSTGSGKTTLINRLLRGVLPSLGQTQSRVLIYDPKGEMYGVAAALGAKPVLVNPLDKRGASWSVSEDIRDPAGALQLAHALVPERESNSNESFFQDATRDLIQGIVSTLIRRSGSGKWSLLDVLRILLFEESALRAIISSNWDTRRLLIYLDGDPRLAMNVRATVNSLLSPYLPIASAWERAGTSFSVRRWSEETGQCIVLGNNESYRASIDAVNRLIFQRMSEVVLTRPELSHQDREQARGLSWFFLDEIREAGHLPSLGRLMNKGRSHGAAVVLGMQDIEGLKDVYGASVAMELLGQANNVAVLRISSPSTAQWASDLFGERERWESSFTDSKSKEGFSSSASHHIQRSPYFLPSQFIYLPLTGPKTGLVGFFQNPFTEPTQLKMEWTPTVAEWLPPPSTEPPQVPVDPDALYPPEDSDLLKRLGIGGEPGSPSSLQDELSDFRSSFEGR